LNAPVAADIAATPHRNFCGKRQADRCQLLHKTQEVAMLPDSAEIKMKVKDLQDRLETLRGHL
jgi:hypothetical protein